MPLNYLLKILRKLQQRAALWISGAFWTSPSGGIETILDLIPIHLYIKKLYNRFLSRGFSFPYNHIIKAIISPDNLSPHITHSVSLNILTLNQRRRLNSPLINMNNKKNKFAPSFDPFNHEFSSGNRLINLFSDRISFYPWGKNIKNHIQILNNLTLRALSDSSTSLVISDVNIKNNVATSISHIHIHDKPVIRTLHCTMNVTSTEAKLLAI